MQQRLQALFVPLLIGSLSLAYWLQIAGQRRAVVLVPSGILVLGAILLVIVVVREILAPDPVLKLSWRELVRPVGLVVLSLGYWLSFGTLGFTISNVLFLFLTFMLMGGDWRRGVALAALGSMVFYALAVVMDFNTPPPFWAQ
jgi:hypothetical protein